MKKVLLSALVTTLILTGCGSSNTGELIGVQGREKYFEPEPLEMAFIPAGSFVMGPRTKTPFRPEQSIKTVTVDAF